MVLFFIKNHRDKFIFDFLVFLDFISDTKQHRCFALAPYSLNDIMLFREFHVRALNIFIDLFK